MFIKATTNVELDLDQVGDVIVQALLADYHALAKDVEALRNKPNLEDYERLDLEHDLETMRAMDTVLAYYMLFSEHESFRRASKKFVELYDGEQE